MSTSALTLKGRESVYWLLASVLLLTIGILKGINLVIVIGYALICLWMLNGLFALRGNKRLMARRLTCPPLIASVTAEWEIELRSKHPSSGSCTIVERVGDAQATWVVHDSSLSDGEHRLRARVQFARRGPIRIQPLVARYSYPFGLIHRSIALLPATDGVVLPKPARVDGERLRHWLFRAWSGRDDERQKVRRIVEREAEVHGLRDYRVGDSQRRIHWKASARRNRLIVREYDDSAPPRLLLIVDPWLPVEPESADRGRLEEVISLAAGVCRDWRRQAGGRLALVIAGPKPKALDGPAGMALTERQWTELALVEGGETINLAEQFSSLSRLAKAAPTLLLSSRADSPLIALVEAELGRRVAFAHVGQVEMWFQLP